MRTAADFIIILCVFSCRISAVIIFTWCSVLCALCVCVSVLLESLYMAVPQLVPQSLEEANWMAEVQCCSTVGHKD